MPRKKKTCAACTLLTARLEEVQAERAKIADDLQQLLAAQENILKDLNEERKNASERLLGSLQGIKDRHKLELIELIVAGNKEGALACLFREDVVFFHLDVRFADTETAIAAKKEQAESLATKAYDAVRTALMPKEETRDVERN